MSYDLYFWRQSKDLQKSPQEVLDLLSEDRPVEGIVAFPREQIRRALKQTFPDIEDEDFELTWEGAGSYFQIGFGHANEKDVQLITATCGFELLKSPEVVNRLVASCASLGCALYDPQTDARNGQLWKSSHQG
jgi:hypothetical protein